MTVATKPNVIEGVDFRRGLVTSIADAAQPDDSLRDVSNLLPQRGSTALKTRRGFARVAFTGLPGTHRILQVFPFNPDGESKRLIAILTNGAGGANNVQVWALDFNTMAGTRIDTAGRTWVNPTAYHWGLAVGKKWYGGVAGEPLYSYDPVSTTWDPDAAADPEYKTWVDAIDGAVNTATEYAKDFAWNGKEKVAYNSKAFRPKKSIRYDPWDTDVGHYEVGNRVSRRASWGGSTYWKSFRCIKGHTPDAATRPGDGTGAWQTYWRKVKFGSPLDEDGDVRPHWKRRHVDISSAAKHGVACWHAERLWGRFDGSDKSRLQFSAGLKFRPNRDKEIANVKWDPTDWGVSLEDDGSGGGWVNFYDPQSHGPSTMCRSWGQYLTVFKRQSLWSLSGESEQTFTRRQISHNEGTFNMLSVTEHEGLLYFADEDGLKITDGVQVQPVPGMENILEFWKSRVSDVLNAEGSNPVTVTSFGGYIWVALSAVGLSPQVLTLVYDPPTASWWKTTLPMRDAAVTYVNRTARMYFVPGTNGGTSLYGAGNMVFEYEASDQDDTGVASQAFQDIPWSAKSAWWGFGTLHQERRIRRFWSVVKGAMTYTIRAFRDWVDTPAKTTARVVTQADTDHIEGEWIPDSHAVSYEVSSTKAPAELHTMTVETEPRRARYHRGG
jgi:hypothetical protein